MKNKLSALLLFITIWACQVSARTPVRPWLSAGAKGEMETGGITWKFVTYDQKWRLFTPEKSFRAIQDVETSVLDELKQITWQGYFHHEGDKPVFSLHQQLQAERMAPGAHIQWTLSTPEPLTTNVIAVEARLPAALYAGEFFELNTNFHMFPFAPAENQSLLMQTVRQVILPVNGGWLAVSGESLLVQILDRRKFGDPNFYIRFYLRHGEEPVTRASLNLQMAFYSFESSPLSLKNITNRTFTDQAGGDGKGGWTDQGPENDLRIFSPEDLIKPEVKFEIPKDGNTAVVLSRHSERSQIKRAEVLMPETAPAPDYLYLLHAGAFLTRQPVGHILFHTAGGIVRREVLRNRDVNDWWRPSASENAGIAWSGMNASSRVGLYLSRFPLPEEAVEKIEFEAGSDAIWMIAGASLSSMPVPLPRETSFHMTADVQWHPFTDALEIVPGSILDFSSTENPKPAGSHGPLRASGQGTFYYEDAPEERVKIWGTSLNFGANFLEKAHADQLAVHFRRMGYNTVRFHHHDVLLSGGWQQFDYRIDPDQLDRLDYMFYRFKKEGLSISTELYQMRRAFTPEVRELVGSDYSMFKSLIPFSGAAMRDWKLFAKDLLGHINPYTGLTWAEDPALTTLCPVNEDTLWVQLQSKPLIQKLAREGFEKRYPGKTPEETPALFHRYIAETQMAADLEMRRYLKEELGYQGLITGNNWRNYAAQTPIREKYDYVDNHGYWDHPSFPKQAFQLPANFSHKSATAHLAEIPRRLFLSRVKGKPFAVTEYNYALPNRYRSEGGALMGTYAARQNWDLIFRFAWSHNQDSSVRTRAPAAVSGTFDMSTDPVNRLSEAFVYFLWLRGDLDPFQEEAVYTVGPEAFDLANPYQTPEGFPNQSSYLGLEKSVSSRFFNAPDTEKMNAEFLEAQPRPQYQNTTQGGSTRLEQQGNLLTETLFSKAAVLQTRSLDPEFISHFSGGPASVLAASRDGLPLSQSKRILVLHLTDALAEDIEFDSEKKFSILAPGKLPHLIRSGKATLHLPDEGGADIKAYAVDITGARLQELPVLREKGRMTLELHTTPEDAEPRMVYEILRLP